MSQQGWYPPPPDELRPIAPQRGWVERLLGISDRGGATSVAVLVGALGAAAFVGSLAYGWQKEVVDLTSSSGGSGNDAAVSTMTFDVSPASVAGLGTVYVLAMVGLLAVVGVAVSWQYLALRLRVISSGVGVGLIGVLIALTIRMPSTAGQAEGAGLLPVEVRDRITTTQSAGLYFAYLAVALLVASTWLAGPSLRRSAAGTAWAPAAPPTGMYPPHAEECTRRTRERRPIRASRPIQAPPPRRSRRARPSGPASRGRPSGPASQARGRPCPGRRHRCRHRPPRHRPFRTRPATCHRRTRTSGER